MQVVTQYKNDVQCRHLGTGAIKEIHVDNIKLFRGSLAEAKKLAFSDADQSTIDKFLAYRGDPLVRTSMEFLVRFADGEELWLPWSRDLFDSIPYETYCLSQPCLFLLVHPAKQATTMCERIRKSDITAVSPDTVVFLDLRAFGSHWYQTLSLPELHTHTYYVEAVYLDWFNGKKGLTLRVPVLRDLVRKVDALFVHMYGSQREPPAQNATLVTALLLSRHPDIIPKSIKSRSPKDFKYLEGKQYRDDEDSKLYVVTRVTTQAGLLVAFVRPVVATGRKSRELPNPIHVADVSRLVEAYALTKGGEKEGTVA